MAKHTAELREIADRLAARRNDPEAMADLRDLVARMNQQERADLLAVLQEMIAEARNG